MHEIVAKLIAAGAIEAPSGCSEGEIAMLERDLGVELPQAYREFLAVMGKCAGGFLPGDDFEYAQLPTLRRFAEELLPEDAAALDPADFVFVMNSGGYAFLFFRCGISDDPPIFLGDEDKPTFERVADSFSSWFAATANEHLAP